MIELVEGGEPVDVVKKISTELLLRELNLREQKRDILKYKRKEIKLNALKEMVEEFVEDKKWKDHEQHIFEGAISAFYDDAVWGYINERDDE